MGDAFMWGGSLEFRVSRFKVGTVQHMPRLSVWCNI